MGNSTGFGHGSLLARHLVLIHHWFAAREEALVRARSQPNLTLATLINFVKALKAAQENAMQWQSEHPLQVNKVEGSSKRLEEAADICS